jgi:hypothetical protein
VRKALGDRASAYFPQALALQRDQGAGGKSPSSSSGGGGGGIVGGVPLLAAFILALLPGLFVGQSLTYVRAMAGRKCRYFGAALLPRAWAEQLAFGLLVVGWAGVAFWTPAAFVGGTLGANVVYFLCIAPDHDTYEAAVLDHDEPNEISEAAASAAAVVVATEEKVPVVPARGVAEVVAVASADDGAGRAGKAVGGLRAGGQKAAAKGAPPSGGGGAKRDWGALQARRSANFATEAPWVCCAFGGINYQVEHHLFPGVSHVW